MRKTKLILPMIAILFFAWMILFQGTSPVSSSTSGITLTPTAEAPKATLTPVPSNTPVATLPPPPAQTTGGGGVMIPVTGSDKSANLAGIVNLGLVLLGFGLISAGFIVRKKK